MSVPRVSIVILNWNGWEDTIECLESLYRITYPNYDVIVVDNGSQDDSLQKIKQYAEGKIQVNSKFFKYNIKNKPIKVFEITEDKAKQGKFNRPLYEKFDPDRRMILIKNRNNYGFTGGNNIGIKFAMSVLNPDYVLLLNNDTVVDPNFLMELVKVAESNEKIGVVGSKIYYYDYNGRSDILWFAGGKVNLKTGVAEHIKIGKIDDAYKGDDKESGYITGCTMLIKKDVIKKIGKFNKVFFAYYEDVELSLRVKKDGWKLVYTPNSRVWHKVSKSSGGELSPFSIYHGTRNWILTVRFHDDIFNYKLFLFWLVTYKNPRRFVYFLILKKNLNAMITFLRGEKDALYFKL